MNFQVDALIQVGYDMWTKIQDYTDAAIYNERSFLHAERQMAREQFAMADAHRKDFDAFYDTILKPMGLAERLDEMISERFEIMAA